MIYELRIFNFAQLSIADSLSYAARVHGAVEYALVTIDREIVQYKWRVR